MSSELMHRKRADAREGVHSREMGIRHHNKSARRRPLLVIAKKSVDMRTVHRRSRWKYIAFVSFCCALHGVSRLSFGDFSAAQHSDMKFDAVLHAVLRIPHSICGLVLWN